MFCSGVVNIKNGSDSSLCNQIQNINVCTHYSIYVVILVTREDLGETQYIENGGHR